ncbi:MAG: PEP-CTERM sorting domain-containing protein [Deltaproteobacteria bacterium]|jgi:hypothetical protein|nr:PEP-CTERM sorting domain-containing protein [Deltaproteobacteria bacterium]
MTKKFLAGLATGVFLLGTGGMAQALSLTDVGSIDDLLYATELANSGDQTELDWVNSVLMGDHIITDKYDTDDGDGWFGIDEMEGVFAHALTSEPAYFLIKTGANTGNDDTHFLFENLTSLAWGVIDLEEMGFDEGNIGNIEKISHIAEFDGGGNEIPEPATMLLFGTGLAGLAAARRRNKA